VLPDIIKIGYTLGFMKKANYKIWKLWIFVRLLMEVFDGRDALYPNTI